MNAMIGNEYASQMLLWKFKLTKRTTTAETKAVLDGGGADSRPKKDASNAFSQDFFR